MPENRRLHWDGVYQTKAPTEVSWYQPVPIRSLELIHGTGVRHDAAIVDVGAGESTLVDQLLAVGFHDLTVLDISPTALRAVQDRLGSAGSGVQWISADVTLWRPARRYHLWHDRAVLHFLTAPADCARYVEVLTTALQPGGHAVIATFGPEGPMKCSGLDVQRYSAADLSALLGTPFHLVRAVTEEHVTPGGKPQQFCCGCWQYLP